MKKIKIEEISTGGGCSGYYGKYKNYTFYITAKYTLTTPTKDEEVSIGFYDKDFETQFALGSIQNFDLQNLPNYLSNALDKYQMLRKTRKHKHHCDVFDLD